jgi:hypothetical protein
MELDDIAAQGDQKAKAAQYQGVLEQAMAARDAAACRRFVDHGERLHVAELPTKPCRRQQTCRQLWATLPPSRPPSPAVLSDAVPLVLSRQLLLAFAQSLQQLPPDVQQDVAT